MYDFPCILKRNGLVSHNNKNVWNKNTPNQHQVLIALYSFYNNLNIFPQIMKMEIHKYINIIH
jgi:hypothetical protein